MSRKHRPVEPFKRWGLRWYQSGIVSPFPLPFAQKSPPPTNATGGGGVEPTRADLQTWIEDRADWNIGGWLAPGVLGIDIDHYDGKHGADTIADLEAKLGVPLPETFVTSARGNGPSGIRYYRVPEGRDWLNLKDVDMIHRGHRYAVLPGSVHPNGDRYRLYAPSGVPTSQVPNVAELPFLPDAWISELDRGEHDPAAKADAATGEIAEWLSALPKRHDPCERVRRYTDKALRTLQADGQGEARHDWVRDRVLALTGLGAEGHPGVPWAIDLLHQAFTNAVSGDRKPREAESEYGRMVEGAVRIQLVDHPSPREIDPCRWGVSAEVVTDTASPEAVVYTATPCPELPADLWEATMTLAHVKQAALSRMASPDGVLGTVLTRVSAGAPYNLKLPVYALDRAGLTLMIGLVANPGLGKTGSTKVANSLVGSGLIQPECDWLNAGTRQGLVQVLLDRERNGKMTQARFNAFAYADEGVQVDDELYTLYRIMFTDGGLGDTNAHHRRTVMAGRYNYGIVVGLQPKILSTRLTSQTDVGTFQRFTFFNASHEIDPSDIPSWPGPLNVALPHGWEIATKVHGEVLHGAPLYEMQVPDSLLDTIKRIYIDHHNAKVRSQAAEDDSHEILKQWKIGASLALLHGRYDYQRQDWELAGAITEYSRAVGDYYRDVWRGEMDRVEIASDERHARREIRTHESLIDSATRKQDEAYDVIYKTIERHPGSTYKEIRDKLSSTSRHYLRGCLKIMLESGVVRQVKQGQKKMHFIVNEANPDQPLD